MDSAASFAPTVETGRIRFLMASNTKLKVCPDFAKPRCHHEGEWASSSGCLGIIRSFVLLASLLPACATNRAFHDASDTRVGNDVAVVPLAVSAPDWTSHDLYYQGREFIAYRTQPQTWADEGGFGLKWGMGPADVAAVYPSLKFVRSDLLVDQSQHGFIDDIVQELHVGFEFKFHRGRLYSVKLDPRAHSTWRTTAANLELEDRERIWEAEWAWRQRIRAVLNDSYGAPVRAPPRRIVARYCDDRAYRGLCSRFDQQEKELRWVWRTARTRVVLIGSVFPRLGYFDVQTVPLVRTAIEVAAAKDRAKVESQSEIDRARVAGRAAAGTAGTTSAPLGSTGPAAEGDVDWRRTASHVLEDDPEIVAEAVPTTKTLPSAWSRNGWKDFRWGMGPGDVIVRTGAESDDESRWDFMPYETSVFRAPRKAMVSGEAVNTTFYFKGAGLVGVHLTLSCSKEDEQLPSLGRCESWAHRQTAEFNKHAGRALCTKDGQNECCIWEHSRHLWVKLEVHRDDTFIWAGLTFDDPGSHPARVDGTQLRATTTSKTWSQYGWNVFRWGMGVGDVRKRLREPKGDLRATREFVCYVHKSPDRTACSLERQFHAFRLLELAPNLSFSFSRERLRSVQLDFQSEQEPTLPVATDRFKALLEEKYGKPSWDESKAKEKASNLIYRVWNLKNLSVTLDASPSRLTVYYEEAGPSVGSEQSSERGKL